MEFEISKQFVDMCFDIVSYFGDGEEYETEDGRLAIGIEPPNGAGAFRLMVFVKSTFVLDAHAENYRGDWVAIPHRHVRVYHPGKWERYITDHLYPKAIEGKKTFLKTFASEETIRRQKALAPIDDAEIFPEVED